MRNVVVDGPTNSHLQCPGGISASKQSCSETGVCDHSSLQPAGRDIVHAEVSVCLERAFSIVDKRAEDAWAVKFILDRDVSRTRDMLSDERAGTRSVLASCANSWLLAGDDYGTLLDTSLLIDVLFVPAHAAGGLVAGAAIARLASNPDLPNVEIFPDTVTAFSEDCVATNDRPLTEMIERRDGERADSFEYSIGRFVCDQKAGHILVLYHACSLGNNHVSESKLICFRHTSTTARERIVMKGATPALGTDAFASTVTLCLAFNETRRCPFCNALPSATCGCTFPFLTPHVVQDVLDIWKVVLSHTGVCKAGRTRAKAILALPDNVYDRCEEKETTDGAPFVGSYFNSVTSSALVQPNQKFLVAPIVSRVRVDGYRSHKNYNQAQLESIHHRLSSALLGFATRYFNRTSLPRCVSPGASIAPGHKSEMQAGMLEDTLSENMLRTRGVIADDFTAMEGLQGCDTCPRCDHSESILSKSDCSSLHMSSTVSTSQEACIKNKGEGSCVRSNGTGEDCHSAIVSSAAFPPVDCKSINIIVHDLTSIPVHSRSKIIVGGSNRGNGTERKSKEDALSGSDAMSREMQRRMRNRAAAARSNAKKKAKLENMKYRISQAHRHVEMLRAKQTHLILENARIRRVLGVGNIV